MATVVISTPQLVLPIVQAVNLPHSTALSKKNNMQVKEASSLGAIEHAARSEVGSTATPTTLSQNELSTDVDGIAGGTVHPVARNGEQSLPSEDHFISEGTVLALTVMQHYVENIGHRTFPKAPPNLEYMLTMLSDIRSRKTCTGEAMLKLLQLFDEKYRSPVERMVSSVPVDDQLPGIFEGIVLECLRDADGRFWSRLLAALVFSGRLAIECMESEVSHHVWSITSILRRIITEKIRPEIERHGGWAGFILYSRNIGRQPQFQTQSGLRGIWTQLVSAVRSRSTGYEAQQNEAAEVEGSLPGAPAAINLFGPLATSVNTLMGFFIRP